MSTALSPPSTEDAAPGLARPEPSTPDGRRRLALLLVLGTAMQAGWRILLCRAVPYALVQPDEHGYLIAARVFAGGPGGRSPGENPLLRRVGYPLLISPAYWFDADHPFQVFRHVQVINAVLSALVFPLGFLFARRVLGLSTRWAVALAFAVAALPAAGYYAQFALIDTVLPPIVLGWLVLLHASLRRAAGRTAGVAAGAGALAGLADLMHVRGAVVVAVHVVLLLALAATGRIRPAPALAGAGAAVAVSALDPVLKAILGGAVVIPSAATSESRLSVHLTTMDGLVTTLLRACGQFWSLTVGTWGVGAVAVALVAAGLVARFRWPGRVRPPRWPGPDRARRLVLAAALAATVGVALLSAAGLPDDGRVNHDVYPRYLSCLVPVWALAGLAAVLSAGVRRAVARAAAGATLLGAAGLLARESVRWHLGARPVRRFFITWDAPDTSFLTGRYDTLRVAAATLVAAGLLVLCALLLSHRRTAVPAVVALVAFNGAALATLTARVTGPESAAVYRHVPRLVADLGVRHTDRVASDGRVDYIAAGQHEREVYWSRVRYFDGRRQLPPPGATVVLAPWYFRAPARNWAAPPGWHRAGGDPAHHWALWRRDRPPPGPPGGQDAGSRSAARPAAGAADGADGRAASASRPAATPTTAAAR